MPPLDPLATTALLPPAGRWAVGVSGGADSVTLLRLLHARGDLSLHVVHLDHQTRGEQSAGDAEFVKSLALSLGLPNTTRPLEDVQRHAPIRLPTNVSARFRALRLALFREVIAEHALDGVLLAHHADDVAETVLHRLLRGSSAGGLTGIEPRAFVSGILVVRPLLKLRREQLRDHLRSLGQPWREDASNSSPRYGRNRLRALLAERPELIAGLLGLAAACRRVRDWVAGSAPVLPPEFDLSMLRDLPEVLSRESARRWLLASGVPGTELSPSVLDRLARIAVDAATPSRQHFPGGVLIGRRRGQIFSMPLMQPPLSPCPERGLE